MVVTNMNWLRKLGDLNSRQWFPLLFLISWLWRLCLIVLTRPYASIEPFEMVRVAMVLASRGEYADPYAVPTGPTAHVAPGYTLILAGIYYVFGNTLTAEIVKEMLSITIVSAQYALLPWLAMRLGMSLGAGVVAGLIGALLPFKPQVELKGDWEAGLAGLLFVTLAGVMAGQWRRRHWMVGEAAMLGLCWGLAVLVSSSLLLALGVLLAGGLVWEWVCHGEAKRYLRYAVVLGLVTLTVQTPWVWRNQRSLGGFVPTRSNLGLELWMSNQDEANAVVLANTKLNVRHPGSSREEAGVIREMGEVGYNRVRMTEAQKWIVAHPGQFAWLTVQRWFYFWFPYTPPLPVWRRLLLSSTSLLAIVGWWRLRRREPAMAVVIGLLLAGFGLIYYLIYSHLRYRYPVDAVILLLASAGAFGLLRKEDRQSESLEG